MTVSGPARVIVAGLGPAGSDLLTGRVLDLADRFPTFLRTRHHPAAASIVAPSFDHVYDEARELSSVYAEIVDRLVEAASAEGTVVYLVPGSPLVAEHTVEVLRARRAADDLVVEVEPAMSFLDLAWERLGVDPIGDTVTVIDGHRFEDEVRGRRGPLLVCQADSEFVLSDIKLTFDDDDLPRVTVLQRLGLDDELVFDVDWYDLDRDVEPDHLTSLWIPRTPRGHGDALAELHLVVGRLRAECPWDRDQSHQSLARYALEEAEEVAEAISALGSGDEPSDDGPLEDFIAELGDLLFQVMLHAAIAEEAGDFTFTEVADAIRTKMLRRHPHVFDREPDTPPLTMAQLAEQWDAIKAAERDR